jgi:hypothetical protein
MDSTTERGRNRAYAEAHEPRQTALVAALRWASGKAGGELRNVTLWLPGALSTRDSDLKRTAAAAAKHGITVV